MQPTLDIYVLFVPLEKYGHPLISLPPSSHSHTPPLPKPVLICRVIVCPVDPYAQITDMLTSLSLLDLLPRFEEFMIKDYVLDCERENIKSCLQVCRNKTGGLPKFALSHSNLSYLSLLWQMMQEIRSPN